MKIVFRCNSRCMGYKPGVIYTTELTPLLKVVLEQDRHLSLIDPPSLNLPTPEPEPELKSEPEPKLNITKSFKKKVEEKSDYGQQESI